MPENQNFYIIKHGIRWTGMPAWGGTLDDAQIWELVTFLKHISNLPPAVDQQWRLTTTSKQPPAAGPGARGMQASHE